MAKVPVLLLALLACSYVADGYKILVIFPLPSKSHSFLGQGIVRHLMNAGHEVTLLTPFVKKNPTPYYNQVDTSSLKKMMDEFQYLTNLKSIMDEKVSLSSPSLVMFATTIMTSKTLEDENVQNLLKDKTQHFDLIIAEWLFTELYASFAAVYNAPLIWLSSSEPETVLMSVIDDYLNPSYNSFYTASTPPFTFKERLAELWYRIQITVLREITDFMSAREYNRLIVPHIEARGRVAPSYYDLKYNASMVLGNSHSSLGAPIPLPQMYKNIGGFHIEDKLEPLPENLKNLMDNAKYGVIYFSMGSNLRSKDWPEELKRDFLNMFGSLKQTMLWKFEDVMSDLPENVHILQWAPQQSILAHPNCVLFVTHGGMLSTTETVSAGKPIIGLPVLGDQYSNVVKAVNKGFAKKVDLSYTMTEDLKEAIEEMISDPKYAKRAKELSAIFHDRPVNPGAEIAHWVEHVVKTGGAPHLRSPALLVPWYQKIYLDLIALTALIIVVIKKACKLMKSFSSSNKVTNDKKTK